MSLVMAAIWYLSRSALHKRSISAVLPEPTGPPTPTRRGPWGFFIGVCILVSRCPWSSTLPLQGRVKCGSCIRPPQSRPEQPRVLSLVPQGCEVGAERRRAQIIKRCLERAPRRCRDDRLEPRNDALAVGLAERHQPHAGGNPIGDQRLRKGGERRLDRDAVPGGSHRHRDGISDGTVPCSLQTIERGAGPGGARRLGEGI